MAPSICLSTAKAYLKVSRGWRCVGCKGLECSRLRFFVWCTRAHPWPNDSYSITVAGVGGEGWVGSRAQCSISKFDPDVSVRPDQRRKDAVWVTRGVTCSIKAIGHIPATCYLPHWSWWWVGRWWYRGRWIGQQLQQLDHNRPKVDGVLPTLIKQAPPPQRRSYLTTEVVRQARDFVANARRSPQPLTQSLTDWATRVDSPSIEFGRHNPSDLADHSPELSVSFPRGDDLAFDDLGLVLCRHIRTMLMAMLMVPFINAQGE